MDLDNKPFLNWFGYSRRERRSTFILLVILMILITIRFLAPNKDIKIEDLTGLLASADGDQSIIISSVTDTFRLFNFDPNSASFDTLTALGLTEKQVRTLISYRNKGGRFRQPADIRKIYGIDEKTITRLIPYINIENDTGSVRYIEKRVISEQKKPDRIDLNRCDSAALEKLPGLGPVLSSRIIKYRKLLGGFASVEQLKEVYGMPEETYKIIADRVFADSSLLTRIKVNDTDFKVFPRHPYLNSYEIIGILKYRELKGAISNISELVESKVLSSDKAKKISPYLKF
jgi:competence protein ComEA